MVIKSNQVMLYQKYENLNTQPAASEVKQNEKMRSYYKLQSQIYNLTRWSFLFGRKELIKNIPLPYYGDFKILEVGCGTGYNLKRIAQQFCNAKIMGMDVSHDMLKQAQRAVKAYDSQVTLLEKPYQKEDNSLENQLDLVVFSYALTMINPHWKELVERAKLDLKPGGVIAVVDFHNSKFNAFKKHMGNNHVRMDGHILPVLELNFQTQDAEVSTAYGGAWEYFSYVGKKG